MPTARTAPTAVPAARRLRGAAVGALTAALAVAGHGVGGGGYPGTAALTLLVLCCAGVGALTTSLGTGHAGGRAGLLAALAGGQVVGHLVLSTALSHHHTGTDLSSRGLSMLAAHAAATLVCAALIVAAERLYGPITRVLRAVLRGPAPVVRPAARPAVGPCAVAVHELLDFAISRRGPPAATHA
ncbi:hypothetical protein FK531_01220 [Rhodococcus spelaei]|uniref:Uncharacterized protein n=1 Tax=Rhodococcus spelaei TaxID=2546320 RepID=A0A541BR19_9NOCA|nr:hypothetical protein [Rhodococcus spelaei]TQF74745.1 hypothetical protein FK531_01220 [Rhodococcus spelaei]